MTRRRGLAWWAMGAVALFAGAGTAAAQNTIWGNDAQGFQPATIHKMDKTTGAELATFHGAEGNGRGIVVVGNTVYYTMTNDPIIHMMDATTGNDLGGITTTVSSMSTIAWDGSHFWTSDYAGTNRAFEIDPGTGNVIKTISLANAQNNMDGMEWFNGKLISNRCDGCNVYDIYDLDGNVLQSAFITDPLGQSTGIAFDGTNFWTSDIFHNSISEFDGSTGAFILTRSLTGSHLIEDLSVDYSQRIDTGGGGNVTPEPVSSALIGTGLGLMAFVRKRRSRKAAEA